MTEAYRRNLIKKHRVFIRVLNMNPIVIIFGPGFPTLAIARLSGCRYKPAGLLSREGTMHTGLSIVVAQIGISMVWSLCNHAHTVLRQYTITWCWFCFHGDVSLAVVRHAPHRVVTVLFNCSSTCAGNR